VLGDGPAWWHLDRNDYSSDHTVGAKMDKLRRTRTISRADRIRSMRRPAGSAARQHATPTRVTKMLNDICDAIARRPGDLPQLESGAGRSAARSSNCGRWVEGVADGAAVEAIEAQEAQPARAHVVGPVSGTIGSNVTFRIAEIAVPKPAIRRAARICMTVSRSASMCSRATGDGGRERRNPISRATSC